MDKHTWLKLTAPENGQPGPWFSALYRGGCSRCSSEFDLGDRIRADGSGGYECCDDDELPRLMSDDGPVAKVCDGCWTVLPKTGVCDNCG